MDFTLLLPAPGPKAVSTDWSRSHVLTLGSDFLTYLCDYTKGLCNNYQEGGGGGGGAEKLEGGRDIT